MQGRSHTQQQVKIHGDLYHPNDTWASFVCGCHPPLALLKFCFTTVLSSYLSSRTTYSSMATKPLFLLLNDGTLERWQMYNYNSLLFIYCIHRVHVATVYSLRHYEECWPGRFLPRSRDGMSHARLALIFPGSLCIMDAAC